VKVKSLWLMLTVAGCSSVGGEGEGEGEIVAEGEDEIAEGEGEVLGEGEGEVAGEGEGEPVGEGEGETFLAPLSGDEVAIQVGAAMFGFLEGPVYDVANDRVLFSDIPGNTIWSVPLDGDTFTDFLSPSGNSNGLLFEDGFLFICEHSGRRVSSMLPGEAPITYVNLDVGAPAFNSPNDLVFDNAGNLYFTDPRYGGNPDERGFAGVYVFRPEGSLEVLIDDYPTPNGIAVSPDNQILYVSDSGEGFIDAYDLSGGSVSNGRRFQNVAAPDGLAIDDAGNLYAATADGVYVYGEDGSNLGLIATTNNASNVAFAGADRQWLYITSGPALFRTRVDVPGRL
jgi:gluconolactonase